MVPGLEEVWCKTEGVREWEKAWGGEEGGRRWSYCELGAVAGERDLDGVGERIEYLPVGFCVFSMFRRGAASAVCSEECWQLGDESRTWFLVGLGFGLNQIEI